MTNETPSNTQLQTTQSRVPASVQGERTSARYTYIPPADIYETSDSIVVLAEMPGVPPDKVDITLERRVLTIRGRAENQEHANYRRIYAEYEDGDYERVFTLSEEIDRDRIEARHTNGVLHLVLPKAESAKARKIELKAA
ncbi:MAG TPA: Hsp20/alpha crystallin family protein [Alphaproteobacteria bacterium]|nr:Hsp20/alpha crystallin family protein [Alphaproteobacteria bacterium]